VTSTTTSGRTQCTRVSLSGVPNNLPNYRNDANSPLFARRSPRARCAHRDLTYRPRADIAVTFSSPAGAAHLSHWGTLDQSGHLAVGTLPKKVGLMPSMDWEAFQRDHHRPYLLVIEAKNKPAALVGKVTLERLAAALGVSGNYAIKILGASLYMAFESDVDATRIGTVFRPESTTREGEWALRALARMDGPATRRISAILRRAGGRPRHRARDR
jgi:hypothetical protein